MKSIETDIWFKHLMLALAEQRAKTCNLQYSEPNGNHTACFVCTKSFLLFFAEDVIWVGTPSVWPRTHIHVHIPRRMWSHMAQTTFWSGLSDRSSKWCIHTCTWSRPLVIGSHGRHVNKRSEQGLCFTFPCTVLYFWRSTLKLKVACKTYWQETNKKGESMSNGGKKSSGNIFRGGVGDSGWSALARCQFWRNSTATRVTTSSNVAC